MHRKKSKVGVSPEMPMFPDNNDTEQARIRQFASPPKHQEPLNRSTMTTPQQQRRQQQQQQDGDDDTELRSPASKKKHVVKWYQLLGLTFFAISGGPFGLEVVVEHGGPFWTVIIFFLIILCWSIPMGFLSCELSIVFSQMKQGDGGAIRWADKAFGPLVSFQNAWWNLLSTFIENTLYPVLFTDYLFALLGVNTHTNHYMVYRIAVSWTMITVIAFLNYKGVDIVGNFNLILIVLVLLPFIIAMGIAFAKMSQFDTSHLMDTSTHFPTNGTVNWRLLILTMLWSSSGFDSIATYSDEVEEPRKAYPFAMIGASLMMILIYIPMIEVAASVSHNYSEWRDGQFVQIAELLGGPVLGISVTAASAFSQFGVLNTEMLTGIYFVKGCADVRILPRIFLDSQLLSVFINVVFLYPLAVVRFERMMEYSIIVNTVSMIVSILAWIRLRILYPEWCWMFKFRGDIILRIAMTIPPLAICGLVFSTSDLFVWMGMLGLSIGGILLYCVQYESYAQRRKEFGSPTRKSNANVTSSSFQSAVVAFDPAAASEKSSLLRPSLSSDSEHERYDDSL